MDDATTYECPRCKAPIPVRHSWLISDETIALDGTFDCQNCHAVLRVQHECFINDDGDCEEWIEECTRQPWADDVRQ